jgi:hypothetical protein
MISEEDFQRDLQTWNSLYVSGRLHKPVRKKKFIIIIGRIFVLYYFD